jgi:hypothetical protein
MLKFSEATLFIEKNFCFIYSFDFSFLVFFLKRTFEQSEMHSRTGLRMEKNWDFCDDNSLQTFSRSFLIGNSLSRVFFADAKLKLETKEKSQRLLKTKALHSERWLRNSHEMIWHDCFTFDVHLEIYFQIFCHEQRPETTTNH